ncbi:MAG TPA: radical SAM protein [Methanosarcinales archaeon]|nr:radical SAM protein [Methanosarcinales archaeon]
MFIMKVAIIYPPIFKDGKFPLLTQNRQYRYSSSTNVRIYPIVSATSATLLKEHFDVLYLDGINERLSMDEFLNRLYNFDPDLVMMETKTPIIKKHWKFIDKIKQEKNIKVALVGDHVSALPEESFIQSSVDYVLTGGDYDVSFLNLCLHISEGKKLGKGIWYRENGVKNTGNYELIKDLDSLPFIDRDLTNWQLYGEAYLYKPCTYIMTGRGCGGGLNGVGICSFCSWQHSLWNCSARLRTPENVAEEIETLVNKYKLKEIFDDNESGVIWNKKWLKQFYKEMKERGLIGEVFLSSNARADCLDQKTCDLLKKIGFRLLKVGLESGNEKTLKKLCKREGVRKIKKGVQNAKDHGMKVMLTIMVGYPWETKNDVKKTYEVARELMLYKTSFGDCLQSSVIIPYPGTPLYEEGVRKDWFVIDPKDYEKYDMSMPVLKSYINPFEWCDKMWSIHKESKFILRSLLTMRSFYDLKLAYTGFKSIDAHTKDF